MEHNEYNDLMKRIKCTDEFRSKMQKKLSSEPIAMESYEDSVSGTDIAPKRSWTRYAAMAAAFVLVCGAVGGAAYGLRQHDKNQPSKVIGAATGASDTIATTAETTTENTTETTNANVPAVSPEEIRALFPEVDENTIVYYIEGPTMQPQGKMHYGTTEYTYTIDNYEALITEITSLEWISCSEEEWSNNANFPINDEDLDFKFIGGSAKGTYSIKDFSLAKPGYIKKGEKYYALQNKSDESVFDKAISNYFVIRKSDAISNLLKENRPKTVKADYTYYVKDITSVKGKLICDAANGNMYMNGDGTFNGGEYNIDIVMMRKDPAAANIVGDPSVFRAVNKQTSEHVLHPEYTYSNGSLAYQPDFQYIYLLKDIERELSVSNYRRPNNVLDFTLTKDDNGIYKYYIKTDLQDTEYSGSVGECNITTDSSHHLISYEMIVDGVLIKSFKLENYKFDSEDFTMEDYSELYNEINREGKATGLF